MAQDPYKYFRVEARELLDGLTQGVLEIEKGQVEAERVVSLLRLAHTLKGASRVVKQSGMAELAHGIEEILSPFREACGQVPPEQARVLLRMLDKIGEGLAALGQTSEQNRAPATRAASEELPETVRVDLAEVKALLGRLAEVEVELVRFQSVAADVNHVERQARVLAGERRVRGESYKAPAAGFSDAPAEQLLQSLQTLHRSLGASVERVMREFGQARELATRLRLLPTSTIFPALVRTVHDAAITLNKCARLHTSGGGLRVEADMLIVLRDALLQLVRNAVAHGIEGAAQRTAAGKPACGRIDVRVERRGERIAFLCRDDGAGIDLEAIRRVAMKKGIVTPAGANELGLRQAIDLIFQGGVSTTGTVNEISGRGIGLDIVRTAVTRLKADISVQTSPGLGTCIEICVPVSMASMPALTVDSDGVVASIPLDCVRQTLRIDGRQLVRVGSREAIVYEGLSIPFVPLSTTLSQKPLTVKHRTHWSAVVIGSGGDMAALGVDRLAGRGTLLVYALPALAPAAPVVHGVTLDDEGNPQLVLNPAALLEAARRLHPVTGPPGRRALPILVVDDSLTTRMVEQGILEAAGYEVELATSGKEALEKAAARPHSLFLVDVEMPGIDGFEFVSRTRANPTLRDVPAILVTSRASPEDRRRGSDSGARAYLVKSEFDQNLFLQTVHELVR